MNPKDGGLSSSDRQRQTVTELARKKVLAAYSNSSPVSAVQNSTAHNSPLNKLQQTSRSFAALSFLHNNQHKVEHRILGEQTLRSSLIQKYNTENRSSLKQTPINLNNQTNNWQKYHSDWQNYYQKYYSEYYAKAAQKYIENEKTKISNHTATPQEVLSQDTISGNTTESKQVETTLREKIRQKANSSFKLTKRHKQLVPLFAGVFSVLFILFLQYNRLIFAPIMAYIAPGNTKDTGITAIDPTVSEAPSADPRLLIPKLNVDVPVLYNLATDTATINDAMNRGVAQFKIPGADAMPGQIGNLVISGHSAGDIYSNNQYKFIFSGLERLVDGDLIYINYNSVRYTYKVFKRETVEPTNVAALTRPTDKPLLTLITCTPLGTDRYRLLVTAEQINPSYNKAETPNIAENTQTETNTNDNTKTANQVMPANDYSFFERIWRWLTGQSN